MTANGHRTRLGALLGLTVASSVVSAVLAAPIAMAAPAPTVPRVPHATGAPTSVIVTGPGGSAAAAAAVRAAGGTVVTPLPLVAGVVAELPAGTVLPGWTVAEDRPLAVTARQGDREDTTPTPPGSPAVDSSPTSTARETLGLTASGPAGAGVTVAVVDTGVADSPDLAGRVRHVDVTGKHLADDSGDGYGHGTFMAGLVAGNGKASGGRYAGAAPKANLLDVRVAADDGSTSLVSVLRGLQVVSASADELDVRVLNLSLSSGSPLPYQIDPLTQALEGLWRQGITVVTAAGNDGPAPGGVSSPGLDPMLLTAGALDEAGTAARGDDTVASYSSRGTSDSGPAKPDLVAPGSHLVSLRAPGSTVDDANPNSRVGNAYFRGTGTSMSTALVSGVVADVLSARPDLSPDQVKALLTGTAYRADGLSSASGAGAGGVDAAAALVAPAPADTAGSADDPTQAPDPSTMSPGEVKQWDRFAVAMLDGDRSAAFAAWQKLSPEARSWVGRSWVALSPEARSWVARSWVGRSWVGADGTADEWLARSWVARRWVARSWVARSWVGSSWAGRSWVGRSWVGRSWVGRSWVDE
ncbi:MAG: serine protease AprX, partial [Frankiaceae bacterium]|nr:serine protease AprX [Frankiaceae bacterium]